MDAALAKRLVGSVDEMLDEHVSDLYQGQPLAQSWARVSKVVEEAGEAIEKLIAWTGQNPRKPSEPDALPDLLKELADVALTGVYAIQHFTKDADETERILVDRLRRHQSRLADAIYPDPPGAGWQE